MCPGPAPTGPGVLGEEQCPGDGGGPFSAVPRAQLRIGDGEGQWKGALFLKGSAVSKRCFSLSARGPATPSRPAQETPEHSLPRQPFSAFYLLRTQTGSVKDLQGLDFSLPPFPTCTN